jgi:hypothetical protein
VAIRHRQGLLQVVVDGKVIISGCCRHHLPIPSDFHGGDPTRRTQFGQYGDEGKSWWSQLRYRVSNPTLGDVSWRWAATGGVWPDQYQRERMIQIHANHPDQEPWPDHGYSSWVTLEDGRILLVDYTNCGDEPHRSHIVGVYIESDDIA